jgi:uncharacterized protein
MRKTMLAAGAAALLLAGEVAAPLDDAGYLKEIEAWRAKREENLRSEEGWLSLVGLSWLKPGVNTVGSEKGSDVVLPTSAAGRVGTVEFSNGVTTFRAAPGSTVTTTDGRAVQTMALRADKDGKPDVLVLGTIRFYVIERSGKYGVRVKDTASPTRRDFRGLHWYPVQESYRITARFLPYEPVKQIPIANILGQVNPLPSPGAAVFQLDGVWRRLDAVLEEPDAKELFFIFRDRTAGKETYPAGRFLYAAMPKEGQVVLDFNKAYSPPCAFTPFATCPLPPAQNRLGSRIEAGEKNPHGSTHDGTKR